MLERWVMRRSACAVVVGPVTLCPQCFIETGL